MSSNFPNGLDNFTNPSASNQLTGPGPGGHAQQHSDINDAVEAIQIRVGVTGSLTASTIDYELHNVEHGHDHDGINSRPVKLGTSGSCDFTVGLFSDFNNFTEVGEAVCKLNFILKALAPEPAPTLDNLGSNNTGVAGNLSFGTSQIISGYTNVTGTGSLPAVDVNGLYQVATFGDDLRRALFNDNTTINGILNDDVPEQLPNYPANSFGNANQGILTLELNGVPFLSANLSASQAAITSSSPNGSFLAVSASSPAYFDDGSPLTVFYHRTGQYSIASTDQQTGWNFLKVVHDISGDVSFTNYVAWVVDGDSTAVTVSSGTLHSLVMTGLKYLTGVKYYTGGTAKYNCRLSSAYVNAYSDGNAVTFGGSTNLTFGSRELSAITGSEDETKIEYINNHPATISSNRLIPGTVTARVSCTKPIGANLVNGGASSIGEVFLYNYSANSTDLFEDFRDEDYRLYASDYNYQADVAASGWDSTIDWSGSIYEPDPLVCFDSFLSSLPNLPDSGGGNGDFTNFAYGPPGNVDYSDFSGNLVYYRKIKNNSGGSRSNFELTLNGTGTIVTGSSLLGANSNVLVEVKLPRTSAPVQYTGWCVFTPFEQLGNPQIPADGAGILDGAFDSSLPATNAGTIGTLFIPNDDYIVLRLTANAQWTGKITSLSLTWT